MSYIDYNYPRYTNMNAKDLLLIQDVVLSNTTMAFLEAAFLDESILARAELMYKSLQRSEPILLSSVPLEEQYHIRRGVLVNLVESIMESKGFVKPPRFSDDFDHELDDYYDECEDVEDSIDLPDDFYFVYLCNYKGEGDGYALYEHVKNLPVYVSKDHSFGLYDI